MPREATAEERPKERRWAGTANIRRPQIGALFWWTIAIIILGICAVLSWFLSIYVFNHPTEPLPYKILSKLDKLDPIEKFASDSPPQGRFRTPRLLLEEDYAGFEQKHLDYINSELLRDYLENFRRSQGVTYVKGEFLATQVRALGEGDMFQSGLVWRGHHPDFPDAEVEMILPTSSPAPPELIPVGEMFDIKGDFFAAVIHVAKPNDEAIVATLVPITYGNKEITPGAKIALKPPKSLNIEGIWPPTQAQETDAEEADAEADTEATAPEPPEES